MTTITEKFRSAKQQLTDEAWCVSIGRVIIEKHCNSEDFGALTAYTGVLAWKDRGPPWEIGDECNAAASTPPGGWAAMVGATAPTWRRWRDRAIKIGLISEAHGFYESGPPVDLLKPIKPFRTKLQDQGYEMPDGEQFARIPFSVLSDPNIGRRARRVMVGLALFRDPKGFAKAAIPTIARVAGLNDRNTQLGLRRLELAGAIKSNGLDRRVRTYEIIEKRPNRVNASDTSGERQRHQTEHQRHQLPITSDTRGERERHQGVNVSDTLSRTSIKKIPQENKSRKILQVNGSGAERRPHPQNGLVLMRVFEGKKDARQESRHAIELAGQTPAPEPTPDARRAKMAELEKLLAPMKHTDPCFGMFTDARAEHLAALGGDTEQRASG